MWSLPGGPRGPEDAPEEVDVVPEGQVGLPRAGVQAALHHPGHVPLMRTAGVLEGVPVLRRLHPAAVSWLGLGMRPCGWTGGRHG